MGSHWEECPVKTHRQSVKALKRSDGVRDEVLYNRFVIVEEIHLTLRLLLAYIKTRNPPAGIQLSSRILS